MKIYILFSATKAMIQKDVDPFGGQKLGTVKLKLKRKI